MQGVLLVSPYHNLCSKSHSLETNSTFDILDSTVATRAAFSYIGALDQLPASHRFRQPSLNPLYLFVSPQKDLPHPAERLPGVYGWSHIHGIKKFKSPYVNPAVCADKDWWKKAMPGGGRTLVSWGASLPAFTCVSEHEADGTDLQAARRSSPTTASRSSTCLSGCVS